MNPQGKTIFLAYFSRRISRVFNKLECPCAMRIDQRMPQIEILWTTALITASESAPLELLFATTKLPSKCTFNLKNYCRLR